MNINVWLLPHLQLVGYKYKSPFLNSLYDHIKIAAYKLGTSDLVISNG